MSATGLVIAVDPGTHTSGLAMVYDGKLIRAMAVQPLIPTVGIHDRVSDMGFKLNRLATDWVHECQWDKGAEMSTRKAHLVCEWPRVYPQRSKEDPNDLLPLAGVVHAFVALWGSCASTRYPNPSDWKQQRPKKAIMGHVLGCLSEVERPAVKHPKDDNCVEAAGIALWAAGREF